MGALRVDELTNIETQHVENHGELLLVKIPKTKTKIQKSFTISGDYYRIVQKYMKLRPKDITQHNRFFITYRANNQKCTKQPIGKNMISLIPKKIANFLQLPGADQYTGIK